MPTPTGNSIASSFSADITVSNAINSLISGTKWGSGGVGTSATITYSFPISSSSLYWSSDYTLDPTSELSQGFRSLTTTEQATFTSAIQAWTSVANITITKLTSETTSNVGDIRVAYTSAGSMDSATLAYAYTPGTSAYTGDVWINNDNYTYTSNEFQSMLLHEIGHTLGLEHPFEGSYTLPSVTDNYKYTVMSYNVAQNAQDYGDSSIFPTTPMLLDIQAIQYLYGANMSYKTGNDVYVFNENTNYYQTIWDAGGTDTIQYIGNNGVTINLNAGSFSTLGNPITYTTSNIGQSGTQTENVAIAYGVTIENAIGGNGNDTLIGNVANNNLKGGAGNDTMTGGLGDDIYEVTEAGDTIVENLNQGIDTAYVYVNNYTLAANVENFIYGSAWIRGNGNALDNTMTGSNGNEVFVGGTGNDTMIGGLGDDIYEVTETGDTIVENFNQGIDTAWVYINNYTLAANLENFRFGTAGLLGFGNELNNTMIGTAGNDTMAKSAGNDTMIGGLGNDIYGVTEEGDVVIENVNGGIDTVWTSVNNYVLAENVENLSLRAVNTDNFTVSGNSLNNVIVGNTSNTTLIGGIGNDTLTGGLGADTFKWGLADKGTVSNASLDSITDFSISQNDVLDLRDLLQGETTNVNTLINYLDIASSGADTVLNISTAGAFNGGVYSAGSEDARITLSNLDLFGVTGTSTETDLLQNLINNNQLLVG
jgi:serralysin